MYTTLTRIQACLKDRGQGAGSAIVHPCSRAKQWLHIRGWM